MSRPEAEHLVAAFRFELGKVGEEAIRHRVVEELRHVDLDLASRVAEGIGVPVPTEAAVPNHGRSSPALSQLARAGSCATRKVAVLVADGVDGVGVGRLVEALRDKGAEPEVLAPTDGPVTTASGDTIEADKAVSTTASVLYDAVAAPCGPESVTALSRDGYAVHFITEAYKHLKPVAGFGAGLDLLRVCGIECEVAGTADPLVDLGVLTSTGSGTTCPRRSSTCSPPN
ncbi:hypothetical protein GCM10029992_58560 [Glycomyces albus]